jgi:hypothetical protein
MTFYKTKYLKYKEKYTNLKKYNYNVGGFFCEFNKDMDVTIYHFTTERLINTDNIKNPTTDKSIKYININQNLDEIKFNNLLDEIIKTCANINILIIINSIYLPSIYNLFNKYCTTDEFKKTNLLNNITLINLTNDNKKVLYAYKNINNIEIFRKNINIFGFNTKITINDNTFFENIIPNKNYTKLVDTEKKELGQISFQKKGGANILANIRLMNVYYNSTDLVDQWWFKWYFSVPPCLSSRLTQSTGTCWMNSIINSLFFIPEIIKLLTTKYNSLSDKDIIDKITFDKFNCIPCEYDLKTLLFSLVNNLLIIKRKASITDGNFIGNIASRVKCVYENKLELCNNIEYGDGGDAYKGIEVILNEIFDDNSISYCFSLEEKIIKYQNKIIDKINEYNDERTKIILEKNKKIEEYNKNNQQVKKLINAYNKKNSDDKLEKINQIKKVLTSLTDEINLLEKKINDLDKLIEQLNNSLLELKKLFEIVTTDSNLSSNEELKKFVVNIIEVKKYPKILILNKNIFDSNVKIGSYNYKLCSSSISLNGIDHAIAGIICNNKSYVYDSNNIIVETNWPEKDISKYLTNETTKELYSNKSLLFRDFGYLIYIR